MSNGIFHLNTNSSKNIEMCFLTEKEFYFVIFLTEKRSLFCSSFYEVTRNKIICFVNTSNAFYIDGNIPMELRTKWPWDSMTFTRRVKQSICKFEETANHCFLSDPVRSLPCLLSHCIDSLFNCLTRQSFYQTRVRSLGLLVTNSLTHWLTHWLTAF